MRHPKKKTIQLISAVVIAIIAIVAISWFLISKQQKNDSTSKNMESSQQKESTMPNPNQANQVQKPPTSASLVGSYTGSSTLVSGFLTFPKTSLVITPNMDVNVIGSGLDLSILGNTDLQVNGAYPIVQIAVQGKLIQDTDTKNKINVTSIVPSFLIKNGAAETMLTAAESAKLLENVKALGIVIPEASVQKPLIVNLTAVLNDNSLNLTNDAASSTLVKFVGTKS